MQNFMMHTLWSHDLITSYLIRQVASRCYMRIKYGFCILSAFIALQFCVKMQQHLEVCEILQFIFSSHWKWNFCALHYGISCSMWCVLLYAAHFWHICISHIQQCLNSNRSMQSAVPIIACVCQFTSILCVFCECNVSVCGQE